jgi:hypothetical protein
VVVVGPPRVDVGAVEVELELAGDVVAVGAATVVDVVAARGTALVVDFGAGAVVVGRGARVTGTVGAGTAGT